MGHAWLVREERDGTRTMECETASSRRVRPPSGPAPSRPRNLDITYSPGWTQALVRDGRICVLAVTLFSTSMREHVVSSACPDCWREIARLARTSGDPHAELAARERSVEIDTGGFWEDVGGEG